MAMIGALLFRVACKCVEWAARLVTFLRRGPEADPTAILVDHLTPAQLQASALRDRTTPQPVKMVRLLVVVPFKDRWQLTHDCLGSLIDQSVPSGLAVHVQLVDNGSTHPDTQAGIQEFFRRELPAPWTAGLVEAPGVFNYSKINNAGVAAASAFRPDLILFLNNDVTWKGPLGLKRLVEAHFSLPSPGAVGATLEYPDGRIQHLFVAPGVKIVAAHPLKGRRLPSDAIWFAAPRPVGAVTGAVLLVTATAFHSIGGFDESLPTVGQDVDLCLKLQEVGLINWAVSDLHLIHHEGATRGHAIAIEEVQLLYQKWGNKLTANAYFDARFSRFSEPPAYRLWEPLYPWPKILGTRAST